jgi:hypothetical protein
MSINSMNNVVSFNVTTDHPTSDALSFAEHAEALGHAPEKKQHYFIVHHGAASHLVALSARDLATPAVAVPQLGIPASQALNLWGTGGKVPKVDALEMASALTVAAMNAGLWDPSTRLAAGLHIIGTECFYNDGRQVWSAQPFGLASIPSAEAVRGFLINGSTAQGKVELSHLEPLSQQEWISIVEAIGHRVGSLAGGHMAAGAAFQAIALDVMKPTAHMRLTGQSGDGKSTLLELIGILSGPFAALSVDPSSISLARDPAERVTTHLIDEDTADADG